MQVVSEVRILPPVRQVFRLMGIDSGLQTVGRHMEINGKRIIIEGRVPRIARLEHEEEWCDDAEDPEILVNALRKTAGGPDILTFPQHLPDLEPKYTYRMELDSIAALPIKSYSFWWDKQIDCKTRNMVRKSRKKGVTVKMASFDDTFVRGMTSIFNETPIRQGRRFALCKGFRDHKT